MGVTRLAVCKIVPCRECGAAVGAPCVFKAGQIRATPHRSRMIAGVEILDPDQAERDAERRAEMEERHIVKAQRRAELRAAQMVEINAQRETQWRPRPFRGEDLSALFAQPPAGMHPK
jgi:hypothetical protein